MRNIKRDKSKYNFSLKLDMKSYFQAYANLKKSCHLTGSLKLGEHRSVIFADRFLIIYCKFQHSVFSLISGDRLVNFNWPGKLIGWSARLVFKNFNEAGKSKRSSYNPSELKTAIL